MVFTYRQFRMELRTLRRQFNLFVKGAKEDPQIQRNGKDITNIEGNIIFLEGIQEEHFENREQEIINVGIMIISNLKKLLGVAPRRAKFVYQVAIGIFNGFNVIEREVKELYEQLHGHFLEFKRIFLRLKGTEVYSMGGRFYGVVEDRIQWVHDEKGLVTRRQIIAAFRKANQRLNLLKRVSVEQNSVDPGKYVKLIQEIIQMQGLIDLILKKMAQEVGI